MGATVEKTFIGSRFAPQSSCLNIQWGGWPRVDIDSYPLTIPLINDYFGKAITSSFLIIIIHLLPGNRFLEGQV